MSRRSAPVETGNKGWTRTQRVCLSPRRRESKRVPTAYFLRELASGPRFDGLPTTYYLRRELGRASNARPNPPPAEIQDLQGLYSHGWYGARADGFS